MDSPLASTKRVYNELYIALASSTRISQTKYSNSFLLWRAMMTKKKKKMLKWRLFSWRRKICMCCSAGAESRSNKETAKIKSTHKLLLHSLESKFSAQMNILYIMHNQIAWQIILYERLVQRTFLYLHTNWHCILQSHAQSLRHMAAARQSQRHYCISLSVRKICSIVACNSQSAHNLTNPMLPLSLGELYVD